MAPHQGDIRCCKKNGGEADELVLTIYDISHKLNINEVIKLMNFNIEFYRDKESKRCYIEEFLDSLDTKSRVHTLRNIQLL